MNHTFKTGYNWGGGLWLLKASRLSWPKSKFTDLVDSRKYFDKLN